MKELSKEEIEKNRENVRRLARTNGYEKTPEECVKAAVLTLTESLIRQYNVLRDGFQKDHSMEYELGKYAAMKSCYNLLNEIIVALKKAGVADYRREYEND